MEPHELEGPRPALGRRIYWSCSTLLVGQGLLLAHLLQHRSLFPVILGRYSAKFSVLLGIVLLSFVISGVFVATQWRRLPVLFAARAVRLGKKPGLLAAVIVLGVVVVVVAVAFHKITALFFPPLVVIGSMAVIYVGLVGLMFSLIDSRQTALVKERTALLLLGLVVGLAIGEAGLRLYARFMPYRILRPHMRAVFNPAPGVMPGITGVSVFTTNADGIRGDPYDPEGRYTLLAVGGSTTECAYLDDTEAWPYLLQQHLNERGHTPPVWVGNVGRSGHTLVEHIHALRYFVPQFEMDAVIVMAGINDVMAVWRDPERYEARAFDADNFQRFLYRSFSQRPLVDAAVARPFPENLALWNLVEQSFWTLYHAPLRSFEYLYEEDRAGLRYIERRKLFQQAPDVIETLPDLSTALDQYERNLMTLVDEARTQGVRLLLTTQPAIYSDHLSEEAEHLLWLGTRHPAGQYRYRVDVLARALGLFNEKLLQVCRATDTECVDLAAAMNGDERYFYDDVHFNEQGARAVAALLADALQATD